MGTNAFVCLVVSITIALGYSNGLVQIEDDPVLQDVVHFALLKIGGGAELEELISVETETVHGEKYILDMVISKQHFDREWSTWTFEECVIEIVDQAVLRWVTELKCVPHACPAHRHCIDEHTAINPLGSSVP